jgi:hypothetical protein
VFTGEEVVYVRSQTSPSWLATEALEDVFCGCYGNLCGALIGDPQRYRLDSDTEIGCIQSVGSTESRANIVASLRAESSKKFIISFYIDLEDS